MEQCVGGKGIVMRKLMRDLLQNGYHILARLARKYIALSEPGFASEPRPDHLLRDRCEILSMEIEQLKQKNADLQRQNIVLAEFNREKDNLISVVAHDLRAPLNRSLSLCHLILPSLAEEHKKVLNLMIQVNNDGLQLVEGILHLDSIGHMDPEPVTINLKHFITDHLEKFFTGQASKKGIQIHTAIENDLDIITDANSLRRIIDNLVSNAVKFSPPDTSVFIRVLSIDNAIHISIQDQGPGISAEDQKKMFRKFQKLTAEPTSGETSTGLGLAIVKKLVENLNGKITVNSELGEGTEFVIRLDRQFTPPGPQF
jgi:two-component system sensor histidine kinase/response regulator